MSTINVASHMSRKSIVKDLDGNIINLMDEESGGWIIRNRQIVNQEKWNELIKKEKDKQEAARAPALAKNDPHAPDRNVTATEAIKNNSRMETIEKRVDAMDGKLDAILTALKK